MFTDKRCLAKIILTGAALAVMPACSSDTAEEPVVPVQIVTVAKSAMQQKITADAVLFPIAQSAIVPKISAPGKKFLVNAGRHVLPGHVLAGLEDPELTG